MQKGISDATSNISTSSWAGGRNNIGYLENEEYTIVAKIFNICLIIAESLTNSWSIFYGDGETPESLLLKDYYSDRNINDKTICENILFCANTNNGLHFDLIMPNISLSLEPLRLQEKNRSFSSDYYHPFPPRLNSLSFNKTLINKSRSSLKPLPSKVDTSIFKKYSLPPYLK